MNRQMNASPLPLPELPAAVCGSEIILMSRAKGAVENTGFNTVKEWIRAMDCALRELRDESKPAPEQKQKTKRQTDHLFFFLKI